MGACSGVEVERDFGLTPRLDAYGRLLRVLACAIATYPLRSVRLGCVGIRII